MHIDAPEVCDGLDNNCDNRVDERLPVSVYFWDADGDGYGNPRDRSTGCTATSPGFIPTAGDCDDTTALRNPGLPEVCDGIDNNCDRRVDEGLLVVGAPDRDGDGFGDEAAAESLCALPAGYGEATDCDDADSAVYPGAPEDCANGVDEGCRGTDENDTVYTDRDGDSYGDPATGQPGCPYRDGWVVNPGDCADTDAAVSPAAAEVCPDGVDNDCDGAVDGTVQWRDVDGDGAGAPATLRNACTLRAGWVTNDYDCDETNTSAPRYVATTGRAGASGTAADPYGTVAEGLAGGSKCLILSAGT